MVKFFYLIPYTTGASAGLGWWSKNFGTEWEDDTEVTNANTMVKHQMHNR